MASPSTLFSVAGKNVLVTGGSRGIGYMIAQGFVQAGANVVLTSRSEEACQQAASALQCQYVASNVSTREGCDALAERVGEIFDQKLHCLINNAGTKCVQRVAKCQKRETFRSRVADRKSVV